MDSEFFDIMKWLKLLYFYSYFSLSFTYSTSSAQNRIILVNGHSHNDYQQERPLYDALTYGFSSIEVDVYLHEGRMVVTHDDKHLQEKPTLQDVYLDPLKTIIQNNGGTVFKNNPTQLVLMIDPKSEKVSTYLALKEIFKDYVHIIEWFKEEQKIPGPIKVLLSGGPPIDLIEKETERYFYIDGSLEQGSTVYPVSLMPRTSGNYRNYFEWYGKGQMPGREEKILKELITLAHLNGRKIRFWGCPNRPEVWKKLLDEGVDWINVDDLEGFNIFYRDYLEAD